VTAKGNTLLSLINNQRSSSTPLWLPSVKISRTISSKFRVEYAFAERGVVYKCFGYIGMFGLLLSTSILALAELRVSLTLRIFTPIRRIVTRKFI
jgi:hypothetical protein